MMSGPSAEFLVKKPLVPPEYEAVWPPFYTWFQTTKSLYIARTEHWPQCTVSQLIIVKLYFIFIHSFIYFAFCKSVQGHKQPRGYRTCPITNTINKPYK